MFMLNRFKFHCQWQSSDAACYHWDFSTSCRLPFNSTLVMVMSLSLLRRASHFSLVHSSSKYY